MSRRVAVCLVLGVLATPSANAQLLFRGDPCTEDCSGHEAGYNWAEQNDVTDPDDCSGNSTSFIEGCASWAEEQQEEGADPYSSDLDNYGEAEAE